MHSPFHFLDTVFCCTKVSNFDTFIYFYFVTCPFGIISKKNPIQDHYIYIYAFSESFKVVALTFKPLTNFELIFVYDVR